MKKPVLVNVLIADGCWAGPALLVKEALAVAGTLHARSADIGEAALFQVELTGQTRAPVRSFTGPELTPESTIRRTVVPQVIVVPPHFFASDEPQPIAPRLSRWLVECHQAGAIIVSMASGVRLLAETGLLDGRDVTGNLSDHRIFARHYPQIRFMPEAPLVIDGRLISASSINPCMDACAYLVQHFVGEKAAHKFSRYTNSVTHPSYERMAMKHAPHKRHGDQRIRQAQEFMEHYFKQDITVEDAARRAAMSVRNFSRRFQQAVGMTAHVYLARCRAEFAKDLLAQPGKSMLQVALQSGFRNEVTLRRAFSQLYATTPTAYRSAAGVRTERG